MRLLKKILYFYYFPFVYIKPVFKNVCFISTLKIKLSLNKKIYIMFILKQLFQNNYFNSYINAEDQQVFSSIIC